MLEVEGPWFRDPEGRTRMLRGVNLGGSSKVPAEPDGATHQAEGFFNHREVSFVGKPFPLEAADEHLQRLQAWGFNFLRLLVTWEAVEHAGPGRFDQAYLDYLREVVAKAATYDLEVLIDPHQDVWSRFSGGDGAPGWTFEVVGLDMTKFEPTGAAIVHQTYGDPFPRMIWPTNGSKLAAATMFTLFFGGDDFAPQLEVDGEPVQSYLQRHYIGALVEVAKRLADLPNVVGFDTMNEPLPGFIGLEDLQRPHGLIKAGLMPTPFQAMLLGAGIPQEVARWKVGLLGERQVGARRVNPSGVQAWDSARGCLWRAHGVWDLDAAGRPRLLRPDHFSHVEGRKVDFARDYYRPFANRVARALRAVSPETLLFIEAEPREGPPEWGVEDAERIVYAPHWYDGYVLYMKDYSPFLAADFRDGKVLVGPGRIRRSFVDQLGSLRRAAKDRLGDPPVLLGEFGVPFDMKDKRSYRTGDFRPQIEAMDRSLKAVEANLLSCALWNYTADNTNARGDQWNGEDLSIFSYDQQSDPSDINSGGRALEAVVRPYPRAVAGEPLSLTFDRKRRRFQFSFRHSPAVAAPTLIFVPEYQYPEGFGVKVSDGSFESDRRARILRYWHTAEQPVHHIEVVPG